MTINDRGQMAWTCAYCDGPKNFEVVYRRVNIPEFGEFEPHTNLLIECTTCHSPYLLMSEAEPDGSEGPLVQQYPVTIAPFPNYVPLSIRSSHAEAVRCLEIGAHTAVALLARRGVEAICVEHDKRRGTLSKKLTSLKEDGVIDERLFEWSSVVRDLGNSGAHDVDSGLTREDAEDSLAFFEALVNYLYTFQRRYIEHQKRRLI